MKKDMKIRPKVYHIPDDPTEYKTLDEAIAQANKNHQEALNKKANEKK